MTPVSFTLTLDDMIAGNRLAYRRYGRKVMARYVLAMVGISLGVTLIAYAAAPRSLAEILLLFGKIFSVYAVLSVVLILCVLFLLPKQRAKKNFNQMPALRREQSVSWDDASIAFMSEYGNARIPFAELYQWAADDGIVIIYPADHLFYMLPQRVFVNGDDRDRLIGALESSLVRRI